MCGKSNNVVQSPFTPSVRRNIIDINDISAKDALRQEKPAINLDKIKISRGRWWMTMRKSDFGTAEKSKGNFLETTEAGIHKSNFYRNLQVMGLNLRR